MPLAHAQIHISRWKQNYNILDILEYLTESLKKKNSRTNHAAYVCYS